MPTPSCWNVSASRTRVTRPTAGTESRSTATIVRTITIRGCRSFENRWTGVHMIGRTTMMRELRVIDCELIDNGMDGLDSKFMELLYISGSTITGNGWDFSNGVGVRVGSVVQKRRDRELRDREQPLRRRVRVGTGSIGGSRFPGSRGRIGGSRVPVPEATMSRLSPGIATFTSSDLRLGVDRPVKRERSGNQRVSDDPMQTRNGRREGR